MHSASNALSAVIRPRRIFRVAPKAVITSNFTFLTNQNKISAASAPIRVQPSNRSYPHSWPNTKLDHFFNALSSPSRVFQLGCRQQLVDLSVQLRLVIRL